MGEAESPPPASDNTEGQYLVQLAGALCTGCRFFSEEITVGESSCTRFKNPTNYWKIVTQAYCSKAQSKNNLLQGRRVVVNDNRFTGEWEKAKL